MRDLLPFFEDFRSYRRGWMGLSRDRPPVIRADGFRRSWEFLREQQVDGRAKSFEGRGPLWAWIEPLEEVAERSARTGCHLVPFWYLRSLVVEEGGEERLP